MTALTNLQPCVPSLPSLESQAMEVLKILQENPEGMTLVEVTSQYPIEGGSVAVSNRLVILKRQGKVQQLCRGQLPALYRALNWTYPNYPECPARLAE